MRLSSHPVLFGLLGVCSLGVCSLGACKSDPAKSPADAPDEDEPLVEETMVQETVAQEADAENGETDSEVSAAVAFAEPETEEAAASEDRDLAEQRLVDMR